MTRKVICPLFVKSQANFRLCEADSIRKAQARVHHSSEVAWTWSYRGVPFTQEAEETDCVLRPEVIDNVFFRKLDVTCKSIGRIHRLGKPGEERPVIIYFQDFNEKQLILSNAYWLKGTVVLLQNDYSRITCRKLL